MRRARAARHPSGDSVLAALIGLGWSERVAAEAIDEAMAASTGEITVSALLRSALRQLGSGRLGSGQFTGSNTR